MAVAVARHLLGDDKVPAPLLRGARQSTLSGIAVASNLARRNQEVPARLLRGGSSQHLWLLLSHDISSVRTKSPRGFCVGRGGLYSLPLPSPSILPGDAKKSRVASARGEDGQHLWPSLLPGISLATTKSLRGFCARGCDLNSRTSPSPGTTPGDTKKSRATSAREETANTYGNRHRPTSPC